MIGKPVYRIENVHLDDEGEVFIERELTFSKDFVDGLAYSEDINYDFLAANFKPGDVLILMDGIYGVSRKPNKKLKLDKFSLSK